MEGDRYLHQSPIKARVFPVKLLSATTAAKRIFCCNHKILVIRIRIVDTHRTGNSIVIAHCLSI